VIKACLPVNEQWNFAKPIAYIDVKVRRSGHAQFSPLVLAVRDLLAPGFARACRISFHLADFYCHFES
jgi:hypothetical protein